MGHQRAMGPDNACRDTGPPFAALPSCSGEHIIFSEQLRYRAEESSVGHKNLDLILARIITRALLAFSSDLDIP